MNKLPLHCARFVCLVLVLLGATAAWAEEAWAGVYLSGVKVGHSFVKEAKPRPGEPGILRRQTTLKIRGRMMDAPLEMDIDTVTWLGEKGKVLRMRSVTTSSGRSLSTEAEFTPTVIRASLTAGTNTTKKEIPIPAGAIVTDDPFSDFALGNVRGTEFYVFDTQSLALVKNTIVKKPDVILEVDGKKVTAQVVVIEDARASTTMYLSAKGEIIKAVGPIGLEIIPETREQALNASYKSPLVTNTGEGDLADSSSIKPDRSIPDPYPGKTLTLRFSGADLSGVPSDEHQTVTKSGDEWIVNLHPVWDGNKNTTIAAAAKAKPDWVKPDVRIPSEKKVFKDLAKQIIGDETRVLAASEKVRRYVYDLVGVNAGIGVMRDAEEILTTKEGVCRDHAVLMAAILRAGNIPTRLVSGLVFGDGAFFYHAWVEVWDGSKWIGFDSTRPAQWVSASHIKTAQGTIADAYTGFLLEGAKIRVIEAVGADRR